MIDLFSSLKRLTKFHDISIDDVIFKMHYRLTFAFLTISSILTTAYQFYGKPITCRIVSGMYIFSLQVFHDVIPL